LAGFWASEAVRSLFLGGFRHLGSHLFRQPKTVYGLSAISASKDFLPVFLKSEQADWPVSTLFSGRIFPIAARLENDSHCRSIVTSKPKAGA
jgi:hypothetical protein